MRFLPLLTLCLVMGCTFKFEEADLFRPDPLPEKALGFQNTDLTLDGDRIGIRLNFLLTPQNDNRPVIFFLHGNGGNVSHWSHFTYRLAQANARVIAIDYPGYGISDGTPSLEGMRQSSLKVLNHLYENKILTKEDTLVLYGLSLGSNPAIWLASDPARVDQFDLDGLVIESGLSNVQDMVTHYRSRIPLDFLVRDQIGEDVIINNDKLIQTVPLHTYFIHGAQDNQIPDWMSQKLAAASSVEPYGIWYVEDANHIEPIFVAEEEFDERLTAYLDFLEN